MCQTPTLLGFPGRHRSDLPGLTGSKSDERPEFAVRSKKPLFQRVKVPSALIAQAAP